jgi:hypothetical protein
MIRPNEVRQFQKVGRLLRYVDIRYELSEKEVQLSESLGFGKRIEVNLQFEYLGSSYYQRANSFSLDGAKNAALCTLESRLTLHQVQSQLNFSIDEPEETMDERILMESIDKRLSLQKGHPLAFKLKVDDLQSTPLSVSTPPKDNFLINLFRQRELSKLSKEDRNLVNRTVHRLHPKIATPAKVATSLIKYLERRNYSLWRRCLSGFLVSVSEKLIDVEAKDFSPIRRPFPIPSLSLFMSNCASKAKSKGCSMVHGDGNKSNLGPLEAQMLWRFLGDLRLKISKDLGMEITDDTEVPIGITTMYQLLMVDLAFFKSELKKLKYKKGREDEEWLGDPFDPDSPYLIPEPRLIAICNSMIYVAAQIYMGVRKEINNMSMQNSTAVGLNVMRGGATKILSWFAHHPNSPYKGDDMFEVLNSMYGKDRGFLPLDIKSMEKAVDEAVKYLKFRTDLHHMDLPEIWTWHHEKYLFLHSMVAEHAIHPVLCIGKTGVSLSLPTSLLSGGPCTTILGEFYQKLLVTDVSYQMYVDYLDQGEGIPRPLILNLNYSDDALLHISNLSPTKLQEFLRNSGAEYNFEANCFIDGHLVYVPILSTDRRNPEGVTFLKMYFCFEDGEYYFFRTPEDMLAKFYYAADGIRDVSHYARRVSSQAYQMGHNEEMYNQLRSLYQSLTGGLPIDYCLYKQEKTSYIRSAGGLDFPSFKAVLVLQKPTQRHIDAHIVQSTAVREMMPGALFL